MAELLTGGVVSRVRRMWKEREGVGGILEGFHSGWLFMWRWTVRVNGVVRDHSERAGCRNGYVT